MDKQDEKDDVNDHNKLENARVGYQVATNLWMSENEMLWSKFNALLLANSIIITSIILSINRPTTSCLIVAFSKVMPFVGIILCLFWLLLTIRSYYYHRYWACSAREIEKGFLNDSVETIARGKRFGDGEEINIKDEEKPLKMCKFVSIIRVKWTCYFIICLFIIVYVLILSTNKL